MRHSYGQDQNGVLDQTTGMRRTHVMPPTFRVVVAMCAAGAASDEPRCVASSSAGILMYEGAIVARVGSSKSRVSGRRQSRKVAVFLTTDAVDAVSSD